MVRLPSRGVVVLDEGIALWFGFGKRCFLARDDVTGRVDLAGIRALRRRVQVFADSNDSRLTTDIVL